MISEKEGEREKQRAESLRSEGFAYTGVYSLSYFCMPSSGSSTSTVKLTFLA